MSENASFARSVAESGLIFIGPAPETLVQFGLKDNARDLAIKAGVPVVPGTEAIETLENAEAKANELGFPVRIKRLSMLRILNIPDNDKGYRWWWWNGIAGLS